MEATLSSGAASGAPTTNVAPQKSQANQEKVSGGSCDPFPPPSSSTSSLLSKPPPLADGSPQKLPVSGPKNTGTTVHPLPLSSSHPSPSILLPPPPTTNGTSSDVSASSPSQSAISNDLEVEDEDEEEEGEVEGGRESKSFPPKVPILRLKKKGSDMNIVFEKQDASKNDSYCWVCHDGGDVLCCDRCPRVFHLPCSGLPKEPEGDEEWFCPVCKNIDKRTKRSRPANLKDLLLLAVKRMMFPGTEIFQKPVPEDIMKHYKEYIFFPMYLNKIKERVEGKVYQTTRQFLHDTEWILHNCIIYNGAKHALTKIAKGIVKVCKEDMREIELCPSCYKLTVLQPEDWFCTPCSTPHRVVLAKVRGYPLWPAKLISETTDKCDVRFFGQHDRSLVPKSCIQELSGPPPTPSSKTQYWNIAMYELRKYRESISAMYQQIGGPAKAAAAASLESMEKVGKPTKEPKPKPPKAEPKVQKPGTVEENHYTGGKALEGEEPANHQGQHPLRISSYIPFSPQLVEVIPSMTEAEASQPGATLLQDGPPSSEPSTPTSEGELQIDLSGGKKKEKSVSPLKSVRPVPAENKSIMGFRRKTHNSLQSVFDSVEVSPTPQPTPTPPLPPTSSPSSSTTPTSGTGRLVVPVALKIKKRGLEGVVRTLSKRLAQTSEDGEGEEGEGEEAHPLFSSSYYEQGKTAIAEIDPEPKRPVRKVKRPGERDNEPSPKKAMRVPNSRTVPLLGQPEPAITVASAVLPRMPQLSSASSSSSSSSQPIPVPPNLRVEIHRANKGKTSGSGAKKRGRPAKPHLNKSHSPLPPPPFPQSSVPIITMATTPAPTPAGVHMDTTTSEHLLPPAQSPMRMEVGEAEGLGGEASVAIEGSGLLAETIMKVDRSFRSRLTQLTSQSEDLGYQYFVEKLMSSIKTVIIEMLSQFEAKGKMGAKVIRDQLHTAWPVPSSRATQEQLKRELLQQLKHELEVVRAAAELEREQVVSEVRRQVRQQAELEKEAAIAETKKKKWCSYCTKEAQYNCCWNANYCNESCQQAHWPEHMKTCIQIRQTPLPSTPTPTMELAHTPVGKAPQPGADTPTEQQTFVFAPPPRPNSSQLAMQPGQPMPSISLPLPPHSSSRDLPLPHDQQQMMHYAESIRQEPAGLEQSMARIDHISNEAAILNNAHRGSVAASPANQQMKTLIIAPQHQPHAPPQAGPGGVTQTLQHRPATPHLGLAKSSVIAAAAPTIIRHSPAASLYQPLMAHVVDSSLAATARDSSPHPLPNSHPSLHPSPISPASPHSDATPSVHNPPGFSWPYQQPVIISSTEGYHVPLLPANMQSSTASSQSFFKAF